MVPGRRVGRFAAVPSSPRCSHCCWLPSGFTPAWAPRCHPPSPLCCCRPHPLPALLASSAGLAFWPLAPHGHRAARWWADGRGGGCVRTLRDARLGGLASACLHSPRRWLDPGGSARRAARSGGSDSAAAPRSLEHFPPPRQPDQRAAVGRHAGVERSRRGGARERAGSRWCPSFSGLTVTRSTFPPPQNGVALAPVSLRAARPLATRRALPVCAAFGGGGRPRCGRLRGGSQFIRLDGGPSCSGRARRRRPG